MHSGILPARRRPCLPNRRTAKPYYGPIHHHDYSTCVITFTQCWYDDFCLTLQEISPCKIQRLLCIYSGSLNVPFSTFFCIKIRLPQNLSCHKKELPFTSTNNNVHRLLKHLREKKLFWKLFYLALWSKYPKNINVQCSFSKYQWKPI